MILLQLKHLENDHGGLPEGWMFKDCFDVEIVKAYNKPVTRQTEEGTFMINEKGELMNSKSEWNQPKIIRTTIHNGGAELAGRRTPSFPPDGRSGTQGRNAEAGVATTTPCQGAGVVGAAGRDGGGGRGEGQQTRRSNRICGT